MKFATWLETDEERLAYFQQYHQALTDIATKYKFNLSSQYMEHEKQYFLSAPIEELRTRMAELPKYIKQQELEYAFKQSQKEKEETRQKNRYKGYYLAETDHERIVCSKTNPNYDKIGMPAFPMDNLKGFYGVHVGSHAWLGILKRDDYCNGNAYLYTIHAEQMIEDGIKVYQMDDPHVSYKDDSTPDSWIIFSKKKTIPAKYITLDQIIPESKIKEAPPPYGME